MSRIEEIRILLLDLDAIRTRALGRLDEADEVAWRRIQARSEELVRLERRDQEERKQLLE